MKKRRTIEDSHLTICVAEDEPKILNNIVKKIELAGADYVVVGTAGTGIEALENLERYEPDVLITDIVMPMMDGLKLIEAAQKRFPAIHFVIVSGHDDFAFAQKAIQFGVDDYLLKPLKIEQLREILSKIRTKKQTVRTKTNYRDLFMLLHGNQAPTGAANHLDDIKVHTALICIGNPVRLPAGEFDRRTIRFLQERWNRVLQGGAQTGVGNAGEWWLIDDEAPNQKFLILTRPLHETLEYWRTFLADCFNPWPVKLIFAPAAISAADINGTAIRYRRALRDHAEIGESQLIDVDETMEFSGPSEISGYRDDLSLLKYLESSDRDELSNKIFRLLAEWLEECPQQAVFEVRCAGLIDMMCRDAALIDEEAREYLTAYTSTALSNYPTSEGTAAAIAEAFGARISSSIGKLTPEIIVALIERYFVDNYHQDIDLSALSDKLGFSGSYLSRIFKRFRGIPPIQYLNNIRINSALVLIRDNPELDFKDVAVLTGFTDQHYFSRVFRKKTGKSPTEFRDT